jgi:hypothetical protein
VAAFPTRIHLQNATQNATTHFILHQHPRFLLFVPIPRPVAAFLFRSFAHPAL